MLFEQISVQNYRCSPAKIHERIKTTHHWEPSEQLLEAIEAFLIPQSDKAHFDTALVVYAQHYRWQFVEGFLWVMKKKMFGGRTDFYYRPVWDSGKMNRKALLNSRALASHPRS